MSSSFLEIVELEDGGFALQRMDSDDEPLVLIDFSDEVNDFLKGNKAAVVKAMIGAGVQAAGAISKAMMDAEENQSSNRILH